MPRANRPSAVDLWPDRPAYLTGDQEPIEVEEAPAPAPPPRREAEDDGDFDDDDDDDKEDDSYERPSRNKNLNPTCVTPLIATLAQNIYRDLHVATTASYSVNVDSIKKSTLVSSAEYIEFMDHLLELVHARPFGVSFEDSNRLKRADFRIRDTFYSAVKVNTLRYKLGDIVIVAAGEDGKHPAPDFPESAPTVRPFCFAGDLFWFGRILSIKRDSRSAHVQWLQHASKTILEELAHPQELFLTNSCGDVELSSFLARCKCARVTSQQRLKLNKIDHKEFFYVFSYDQTNGAFKDISEVEEEHPNVLQRRHGKCGLCTVKEEEMELKSEECIPLPRGGGPIVGFERAGVAYHNEDAVLISPSTTGPCQIGKMKSFVQGDGQFILEVQLFERMNDLIRSSEDMVASQYEERHLFLTDQILEVSSNQVVGKAFVLHRRTAKNFRLRGWLDASPGHFYITKTSPSMDQATQGEMAPLSAQDFVLCEVCIQEEIEKTYKFLKWRERTKTRPLRIFDPFAGSGAFVLGICEMGTMEFTHAIDIAPSAAETVRRNSPGTVVYNQCSNKMLEYAVSRVNGSNMTLTGLVDDEDLPEPPRHGDIDCIVSGFPCQPHSTLNMFQRAHDLLNELFLNTVSWVEHLRPKYCLFENVRGFTRHRIGAEQKDHHTVHGGIEQGGIKFVCRALTALGYQVRFAICQAANYGTPQTRERFFLWAALPGLPLPEFPPPTHDFPTSSLAIRFTNGDVINPIGNEMRPAALPFVTVADAISDLKRWDWVNPHKVYKKEAQDRREEEARRHIEQVRSHYGDESCGIGGTEYDHEPRSAFQARCRRRPAEELQHITPCLPDEVIERTCNIPVEIGANYKNLNNRPGLWQWQMFNPSSANARRGYKDTMYRRLEEDQVFQTTVTNVLPTAKQSKVLNPWCKRMVTVRELARSQGFPDDFLFEAVDGKVRTMHRLIGNAVPWQMSEALGRELEKAWYKETRGQMDDSEDEEMED